MDDIQKKLWQMLQGYQPATILTTANRLKVFDQISEDFVDAQTVAKTLGMSTEPMKRLLNALVGLGFADKDHENFRLLPEYKKFLTQDGEHCLHQWIHLTGELMGAWQELPRFIESGKNVTSIMEMLGSEPKKMRAFTDAMHDKGLEATWLLAREIPVGEYSRMLDVGGGPGTYSLEWAKLHTKLKSTVFDIPPVVEIAKQYIARYGLKDRVDTLAGDFQKDDLGTGYDLILLANVLHMYDPESAKSLVLKAFNALDSKGRLVIHGFCTDKTGTQPIEDVLFSINIGLLTPGGRAHSVQEKSRWIEELGMKDIRHFRVDAIPTGVITAVKP